MLGIRNGARASAGQQGTRPALGLRWALTVSYEPTLQKCEAHARVHVAQATYDPD